MLPLFCPCVQQFGLRSGPGLLLQLYLFFISYSLFLISYSLFLISYSLFLIPYFLFLIPYSLFLIPYFLFLISYFLLLTSYFLFLIPYFLFLIPYSLIKPDACNLLKYYSFNKAYLHLSLLKLARKWNWSLPFSVYIILFPSSL